MKNLFLLMMSLLYITSCNINTPDVNVPFEPPVVTKDTINFFVNDNISYKNLPASLKPEYSYSGFSLNGYANNKGTLVDLSNRRTYVGLWSGGYPSGSGVCTYDNGDQILGSWHLGKSSEYFAYISGSTGDTILAYFEGAGFLRPGYYDSNYVVSRVDKIKTWYAKHYLGEIDYSNGSKFVGLLPLNNVKYTIAEIKKEFPEIIPALDSLMERIGSCEEYGPDTSGTLIPCELPSLGEYTYVNGTVMRTLLMEKNGNGNWLGEIQFSDGTFYSGRGSPSQTQYLEGISNFYGYDGQRVGRICKAIAKNTSDRVAKVKNIEAQARRYADSALITAGKQCLFGVISSNNTNLLGSHPLIGTWIQTTNITTGTNKYVFKPDGTAIIMCTEISGMYPNALQITEFNWTASNNNTSGTITYTITRCTLSGTEYYDYDKGVAEIGPNSYSSSYEINGTVLNLNGTLHEKQ